MSLDQNPKSANTQNLILKQALLVTEVAINLRERHSLGEKYISYLKTLINGEFVYIFDVLVIYLLDLKVLSGVLQLCKPRPKRLLH